MTVGQKPQIAHRAPVRTYRGRPARSARRASAIKSLKRARESPRAGLEPDKQSARSTTAARRARSTCAQSASASRRRDRRIRVEERGLRRQWPRCGRSGSPAWATRSARRSGRGDRSDVSSRLADAPTVPPRNVTGRGLRPSRARARATLLPLPPTTSRTAVPRTRVARLPGGDRQRLVETRVQSDAEDHGCCSRFRTRADGVAVGLRHIFRLG